MSDACPHQVWWRPAEIAEACLPDMPASDRGVRKLAEQRSWAKQHGCVRRRAGKGGGHEFHFSLFPQRAQDWLIQSAIKAETNPETRDRDEAWAAFEALPAKAKEKARFRAEICRAVAELERHAPTRSYAVDRVAATYKVGKRSVWNWLERVERVRRDDWPTALAGQHKKATRDVAKAEISEDAWAFFKADYLRPEAPALTACVRRLRRVGASEGWEIPSEQTIRRLVTAQISKQAITLARKGAAALKDMTPPVIRDKSMLHAMQMVDADFHKFDVFVEWAEGLIIRPQMCAIHDLYSGRIVGWRMAETPNAVTVMLTIGDTIEDYGIPSDIFIDNGREFAAKWITGGAQNRFRFKVNDDDPLGVLPQMGVKVHFTTPYSGQSKPIERSFRDLCEDVAKDPRFRGAYVGNRPDAKPENYGSRAVSRDQFMRVVAEGIEEFNARVGRRAAVCKGRSFDEVFAASYSAAPIRKATPEQARLWLLGSKVLKGNRSSGELGFQGNKYWADWMVEIAGEDVVARFDPEDLHAGLHVYDKAGAYLGHADCRQPEGFADLDAAREIARRRSAVRKAAREQLKAQITLDAAEMDQLLDNAAPAAPADLDAKVIAHDFKRAKPANIMARPDVEAPVAPVSDAEAAAHEATIIALTRPQAPAEAAEPTSEELYLRARALIDQMNAGQHIGSAEARWLEGYRDHPDFKAHQKMAEAFGDQIFEGGAGRGAE